MVEKAILVDSSPVESIADLEGLQQVVLFIKNINIPKEVSLGVGRQEAGRLLQTILTDSDTIKYIVANLNKSQKGE